MEATRAHHRAKSSEAFFDKYRKGGLDDSADFVERHCLAMRLAKEIE